MRNSSRASSIDPISAGRRAARRGAFEASAGFGAAPFFCAGRGTPERVEVRVAVRAVFAAIAPDLPSRGVDAL
ncbi:MAG: hypothetical protein DWI58_14380 [Chloroflexi bacterium]|nr:MAG: hypothetical protein DWI58_14380 [Chloroflexota bacterium]